MEDCLEQNMSLIKRLRPDLYKKLKEVFDNNEYSYNNIEEADTRDGNKALITIYSILPKTSCIYSK